MNARVVRWLIALAVVPGSGIAVAKPVPREKPRPAITAENARRVAKDPQKLDAPE